MAAGNKHRAGGISPRDPAPTRRVRIAIYGAAAIARAGSESGPGERMVENVR